MDIDSLIRKNIRGLKPYSSARDEFQGEAQIYLDANENPNPSAYNRYPDPLQRELKKMIGGLKQIHSNNIFLGNGSDEVIDLLFRAFCEPGIDNVLIPEPTYGMYAVSASVNNVPMLSVSFTPNFEIEPKVILAAATPNTKLLFLCSPNNPSGNLLSRESIFEIIQSFNGLVVIDEAYIDFANQESYIPSLINYPNLVILQTLSKAWGLAAIRLGMCFASEQIVGVLNKIKPPYNISLLTQQVAMQELQQVSKKEKWVQEIIAERTKLLFALPSLSLVEHVYPSDANFLLVRIKNAKEVYRRLISQGIVVRDRSSVVLCENCLRI
ncbi:MAG: histidinol-phosphate transaminase, partial [Flammeovirgaceae bacterium]